MSPSDNIIRVRFPCPLCDWVEKGSKTSRIFDLEDSGFTIIMDCFDHGTQSIGISVHDEDGYIDTNTPLRSIIKGCLFSKRMIDSDDLIIMVDGRDWSGTWLLSVFSQGLSQLGFSSHKYPVRLFAPMILDWSGAKFSKTLYVEQDAYAYLPKGFSDFNNFISEFGETGLEYLWEIVCTWVSDPKKFFRDYSIEYLGTLLSPKEKK